ncbi:hypothetical protein LTR62_002903 [Meristemomyces frigidus]|uniref:Rhodopsin domain-containing protein n=1 Tax=Meristemomyces frigidus TaxID=1508187 RepID=A0AAN7TIQ9_9PEZI|nr:hypothetical protein LTR62_002903 [Meristemomyces frigidus]
MVRSEPGIWSDGVPNRGPILIIISIVFGVVTTAFWLFRQVWRWVHRQRGWDDVMAGFAYLVLVVQTVFGAVAVYYGFGKHKDVIGPTIEKALEFFYLYQICYKLLGGFTKLTFCFLYLRIFNQRSFHRAVIVVAAIVAAGSVAFALATVFQCTPVHKAWNRMIPGHCTNNTEFWYTHATFNIVFDIIVYMLPIPMIRTLKLGRGQKTGLISIFALGAFTIAAAIVRMVMLRASAGSTDPTWGSMVALYWTEIEANCSVICCCLPALRVPFMGIWQRLRHGKNETFQSEYHPGPLYQRYGASAFGGPQQAPPIVISKQMASHGSENGVHSIADSNAQSASQSHNSSKTGGGGGGSVGGDWVDRILNMNMAHKEDFEPSSRSASREGLPPAEQSLPAGLLPSMLELGAIYKTTDLRVTTHEARREEPRGADDRRRMSLKDILAER